MQLKSTRGVQQEDVWGAADALVAEGLRPTIERVRQKIGRGSPNTVSPMLEAWFATLGPRLGVTDGKKATAGELPAAVRQAMTQLWETALLSAQGVAEQGLLQKQQTLADDRAALERREAELASREQGFTARQDALNEVLQVARSQNADLTSRLEQSQTLTSRQDGEIEALRSRLSALDQQHMADQGRREEEIKRHAQERQRLEAHATVTERRLMTELDRERQETKRLKSSLREEEQSAETVSKKCQEDHQMLTEKLREVEVELRSERQVLVLANERTGELRGLLDDQRRAHGEAIAQLSKLLAEVAPKAPASAKPRKRVRTKASNPAASRP